MFGIYLFLFSLSIYISARITPALGFSKVWAICAFFVIMLLFQRLFWEFVFQFFPLSYRFKNLFLGFLNAFILFGFMALFLTDILSWGLSFWKIPLPHSVLISLLITFIFCLIGLYEGTKLPEVKKITLDTPFIQKPLKIVQLSDLHLGSALNKKGLEEIVQKTNILHPDIIVLTGDLIDLPVEKLKDEIEPLFDLKAEKGVFVVFGNHEYYRGSKAWEAFFKDKFPLLHQKIVQIPLEKNVVLALGGVEGIKNATLKPLYTNLPDGTLKIFLSHYPSLFQQAVSQGVHLQLSGHTHGGQLFYPFNEPAKKQNSGFLKGIYRIEDSFLYVSSGVSLWAGFPLRFSTPSEITEIILIPQDKE